MSEFEKDLKYLPVHIRTLDGDCYEKEQLIYSFKDWQPPKEKVEVPQFVADWFENNDANIDGNIDGNIKDLARILKDKAQINWTRMDKWFMKSSNSPVETLIRMKLEGYTVEKEQLYEVVLAVNEDGDRYLLLESDGFFIDNESMNEGYYKQQFTEAEIKDIDERYWAFSVKVDEA